MKRILPRYRGGKGDGLRYIKNDDTGGWDRITNDDESNFMSDLVITPYGVRNKFDYESNPNYRQPIGKNAVVRTDHTLPMRLEIEKINNTRTWRSDVADVLHSVGEGAIMAANFVPFEGELAQGANWLYNTAKSYIKHPFYNTVYHGSPYPFNIRNAWTATPSDLGLHVGGRRIAESMQQNYPNGVVYKLRIPEANTETIDIGANGYKLLSNDYFMAAHPYDKFSTNGVYDTTEGDYLKWRMLEQQGALPTIIGNRLYTEKDAILPIRNTAYPNISDDEIRNINEIFRDARMRTLEKELFGRKFYELDQNDRLLLNLRANDILSRSGYKVIKYNNSNPYEGGGGTSYIITDPSIMDVIPSAPRLKPLAVPTGVDAAYAYTR